MPRVTTDSFDVRVGCDVQSIDEVRAAIAASGDRYLAWPQIEVLADETGASRVRMSGAAAELSAAGGIDDFAISISHAESFAFAVAMAIART